MVRVLFSKVHVLLCGGAYITRAVHFPSRKKKIKKNWAPSTHTFAASAGVSRAGSKTSDDDDGGGGGDGGGSVSAFDGYSLSGS